MDTRVSCNWQDTAKKAAASASSHKTLAVSGGLIAAIQLYTSNNEGQMLINKNNMTETWPR